MLESSGVLNDARLGAGVARAARGWRATRWLAALLAAMFFLADRPAPAQTDRDAASAAAAQVDLTLPQPSLDDPITVEADHATHWTQGAYEVWHLKGSCMISQGLVYARAAEGIIWVERGGASGDPPHKLIAYLEGNVTIDYQTGTDGIVKKDMALLAKIQEKTWLGRFMTTAPIKGLKFRATESEPAEKPAIYERGMEARDPKPRNPVKTAQFAEPNTGINAPAPPPGATPAIQPPTSPSGAPLGGTPTLVDPQQAPPVGTRRLRAFPRSDTPLQLQTYQDPTTGEWIAISSSGINLVVDGVAELGSVDVSADRLVMWTQRGSEPLMGGSGMVQDEATPLELYLEGNIAFRQGDRVLFAQRMYYDVRRQVGVVLDAEMSSGVPTYDGAIKLRSRILEQLGPNQFLATGVSLTSSRLGVPSYDLRTGSMLYEDVQQPVIDAQTGQALVDAEGDPLIQHTRTATSRSNTLYFSQVPVFYWPYLATNLEEPSYYVRDIQLSEDRIFGTAAYVDWNAYQIFGIRKPPTGTRWDFSTDYLSLRGPAAGTAFTYRRDSIFGYPYNSSGLFDAWGIHDSGHDDLGLGRRDLEPEKGPWRGRIFSRNRLLLPNDFSLTTELAVISDYNFMEQYFEQEWDQFKNETNDVQLKQQRDNWSWAVYGQMRLNDFYTETQWMPRLDHFTMGQSLLGDRLTWFEHTNAGYAQLAIQQPPTNAADLAPFSYLPWEPHSAPTVPGFSPTGDREATRQELDLPFDLGGFKLVPYTLGEVAHWGQVLDGNDLSRAYGMAGVRASVPFWSVNPNIHSTLLNVNGLAHKISFDVDASVTESSQNLNQFPLYDLIDDTSIIRYRQLLATYDFGTPNPVPLKYDERYYALRYGLMNTVSSTSTEIAGNLAAVRMGMRQRLQTKRGMPGRQRVVDWMTFDVQGVAYPDPNRDNFGTAIGLVNYTYRWYLGDRTTVVSDGAYDFFSGAPQYTSLGMYLNRPPRGSLYAGVMLLNGPVTSTVLASSYNYRMSPKWISTAGSTFALNHSGNIGENFALTRIGESFLFNANFNVDVSKGNVGVSISVQPRFLSRSGFGAANGLQVPVAGAFGLE
ncbi:MAG TPA: hypothetical protein VHY91_07330 [Pirellulales bacterium]|nr:hypothetical protein [Pirellulales bacterium]